MFPDLVLWGRTISSYQVLAIIGIFAAGIYACKAAARKNLNDNDMIVFLLITSVGIFFGGHLFYALTQLRLFSLFGKISSVSEFFKVVYVIFGGSVFYGGLLGGILVGYLWLRHRQANLVLYADIMAPTTPLFHFFGRLGCFFSGCCYGIPCSFGFVYEHAQVESANGIRRFPVQLAEAALELVLFIILARLLARKKLSGRLFPLYLIVYSVSRFLLEFLRGDEYRGFLFGLSTSQLISIPVLIFSLCLFCRKSNQKSAAV